MSQTQATSIPYNGSGTINIHINNPSANVGGSMPYSPMMPAYPCYPFYCYPMNYYLQTPYGNGVQQVTNVNNPANKIPENTANNQNPVMANASKTNKKEREVVVLTDEYIKNLENYLRNNNVELRKQAARELLQRFKEDKTRLSNPSLTALLNLALQDENSMVKTLALAAITSGYAKGDANTEQILRGIQNSKENYSLDAIQASDALLQMSKQKVKVPDNSHYPEKTDNSNKKGS